MHPYVRTYSALAQSPDISPVEHLEMLRLRDELQVLQNTANLDDENQAAVERADLQLLEQANLFAASLSTLVDLEHERSQNTIPARRWWWFLDVIQHMPTRSNDTMSI